MSFSSFRILLVWLVLQFTASAPLTAQYTLDAYRDVVHVLGEKPRTGRITRYEYGERVVLELKNGGRLSWPWERIKRVTFRHEATGVNPRPAGQREPTDGPVDEEGFVIVPAPDRRLRHELLFGINVGQPQNVDISGFFFSQRRNSFGINASYAALLPIDNFVIGGGVDYTVLDFDGEDAALALIGSAEYGFGRGRTRLLLRFQGGLAYPIGSNGQALVEERDLSPLLQPTIGVSFSNPRRPAMNLYLDLGYRFVRTVRRATAFTLDVVEVTNSYQRLLLRGGVRF